MRKGLTLFYPANLVSRDLRSLISSRSCSPFSSFGQRQHQQQSSSRNFSTAQSPATGESMASKLGLGTISPPISKTASGAGSKAGGSSNSSIKKKRDWKIVWLWRAGIGGLVGGAAYGFYFLGSLDDPNVPDQYSKENLLMAYFLRSKQRIQNFIAHFSEPSSEILLPDPLPYPHQKPYTLVIDLDDTLVHSTWTREKGWKTLKRPGVEYFLAYLSEFFEIVIFTQQPVHYAKAIIDKIDPAQAVQYHLYRDSTRYEKGKHYKDLSKLNRDLSHVLLLEDDPTCTYQADNLIQITPWKGDSSDNELIALLPFLETLAVSRVSDVRSVLKSYSGKHIPTAFAENQQRVRAKTQQTSTPQQGQKGLGLFRSPQVDLAEKQALQHKAFQENMRQLKQQQQLQQQQQPNQQQIQQQQQLQMQQQQLQMQQMQQMMQPEMSTPPTPSTPTEQQPAQSGGGFWGWFSGKKE